jgi:SecD/SecF fusion protein
MQNKGAIKFLAIVFALVSLYQLSFTFCSRKVEKDAVKYANHPSVVEEAKRLSDGNVILEKLIFDSLQTDRERAYLDSMMNEPVMNLLIKKYKYKECKERELNLGLDLKGGMNVTLEVAMGDLLVALSGNNPDPRFNQAIQMANEKQKTSQEDYIDLFYQSLQEVAPGERLAAFFLTEELRNKIKYDTEDAEVLGILRVESDEAFDRTFEVLRNRIDRFGVSQPNIQRLATNGRILIELPGIKDPVRVRKLLQSTAKLEFWETYEFFEVYNYLEEANRRLPNLLGFEDVVDENEVEGEVVELVPEEIEEVPETPETEEATSNLEEMLGSTEDAKPEEDQTFEEYAAQNPLFAYLDLRSAFFQDESGNNFPRPGPVVGFARSMDTARINHYLALTKNVFPSDLKFLWSFGPVDLNEGSTIYQLIAIKTPPKSDQAALGGDVITDAFPDFDEFGRPTITMVMNTEGAKIWKRMTADNSPKSSNETGRSIAIVLDDQVYSWPTVNQEIPTGRSTISGTFSIEEATDFATKLKSGKLAAPTRIVEEAIVGPSLGQEAINSGLLSFLLAFLLVLIYMIFFYNKAGVSANLAMITNMFFVFGVLASLQAVLTLPGIAGIILTLGMSVDANVIIYERIKEELLAGKGVRLAIADGYKNAYSAIIDGNVTTLLTGIVLYVFGSGPVQGFATTLIIGIITSLFCSIFITRLFFIWMLDKNYKITFDIKLTRNFLAHTKIDFLSMRKKAYIISAVIVVIGVFFLFTRGLNLGVDFSGGRSYIVRFDRDVVTGDIAKSIEETIGTTAEVKTFGPNNQVKITTKYLIEETSEESDSIVEQKIFESVSEFYNDPISYEEFVADDEAKIIGRLSSQKVGPTIARDIKRGAVLAVVISLIIIFAYIAVRFKRWQYGAGALIALFHDALIAVSLFSIFYGIMPFSLEVDQAFIAAILTIIGYSVNDTVIIFDRIRENKNLFPKRDILRNMNDALNSTLSRTVNTAGTTFVVLLAIFIFGGEVIRGFTFALLVGVTVGTYSSIFVAAPTAFDFLRKTEKPAKQ